MKLENLKYFVTVAQTGSINKAAELLYISQQSLSVTIKRLEEELNATLFIRNNKGIVLSDEGKILYEAAMKMLPVYEDAMAQIQKKDTVVLDLYTVPSLACLLTDLQSVSLEQHYASVRFRNADEMASMILNKTPGIFFMPIYRDSATQEGTLTQDKQLFLQKCRALDGHKDKYVVAKDTEVVMICHKDNEVVNQKHSIGDLIKEKVIITSAHYSTIPINNGINIDNIDVCKKMLRDKNYIYMNLKKIIISEFVEDEWSTIAQRKLGYDIEYTVFFNLPYTAEFRNIRNAIREILAKTLK